MIYSKPRNFLFLRVPKTGSTSVVHHLVDCIPKDEITLTSYDPYIENINQNYESNNNVFNHFALNDLVERKILTYQEIVSTRVFAFIRDPVDWFLSLAHYDHVCNFQNVDRKSISYVQSEITNEEAVDRYLLNPEFVYKHKQQHEWLLFNNRLIDNIIPYPNFDEFFKQIGVQSHIKYNHRSHHRTFESRTVSDKLREKITSIYAKDWEIWQRVVQS